LLSEHPLAARQFRLFCLQQPYAASVDYNDDRRRDAAALDRRLAHFFTTAAEAQRRVPISALANRAPDPGSPGDLHPLCVHAPLLCWSMCVP
jgi:cysteinyl-tRNA synthetase